MDKGNGGSSWQSADDFFNDFDLVADFYDPEVEKMLPSNISMQVKTPKLQKFFMELNNDTDDNINYVLPDSDLVYDPVKELEVQESLRNACGLGYSNNVIESNWNKNSNNENELNNSFELLSTSVAGSDNNLNSNNLRRTTYNYQPKHVYDSEVEAILKTIEKKEYSGQNIEVVNDCKTILKCSDSNISITTTKNEVNSELCSKNDNIVYSSDENIVVDEKDVSLTNDKSVNKKCKKARKKFKVITNEVDVKLPNKSSSYSEAPIKNQFKLNPSAPEFISFHFQSTDQNFSLNSHTEFPPL